MYTINSYLDIISILISRSMYVILIYNTYIYIYDVLYLNVLTVLRVKMNPNNLYNTYILLIIIMIIF